MSTPNLASGQPEQPPVALDREDERLGVDPGLGSALRILRHRVQSGELGALPVVVGLVVICAIFEGLNSVFLQPDNIVNLLLQTVPTGTIALGIVCVLLLGEIDLSVGSVSGATAAITALLYVSHGWPAALAILVGVAFGLLIGLIYSQIYLRLGIPSFVITLGGLLTIEGLQLQLLGSIGAINIPFNSGIVNFAQRDFVPEPLAFVIAILVAVALLASGVERARRRRSAGLTAQSLRFLLARSVLLGVCLCALVAYLAQDRGVGWMFVFFAGLVAVMEYVFTRTRFGRSMYAIGGNAEAARRAGINLKRMYIAAFVLCSMFAAVGGILNAVYLASANQQSGAGDVNLDAIAAAVIGGTSLFGGRGSAVSALLGVFVITAITNGLTLLNLSSAALFMITGGVLLVAVAVDSLARRTRASSGRA
ncbi:MAG TPA: sugar ABC transporter permease [Solirubrobacteraceae bacterium]|nr:sugar ABC transporter permease [Solirubrobacteraceae bacterium]